MANPHDINQIIRAAIDSVRPSFLFPQLFQSDTLPDLSLWRKSSPRFLLTIGKAAAESAESVLKETDATDYRVLTPPLANLKLPSANVLVGSHPIPDERSFRSTAKLLEWLNTIPDDSALLIVVSGGTSALLTSPAEGISLDSKKTVNKLLIRCGASIHEINAIRKHISSVKGGRLAEKVSRLRPLILVISDVIGDNLETIGSGPFYPDPTTFAQAKQIADQYGIWNDLPDDVRSHLLRGVEGKIAETPKPGEGELPHFIIVSNQTARNAAAKKAEEYGYNTIVVPQLISGLVEDGAQEIRREIEKASPNSALIMGGEVTVRWHGHGKGGRNQHLCLLLVEALHGKTSVFAAAGTDGIDGNSDAAGAWIDGETLAKARTAGLDLEGAIREFESNVYFHQLNQTIQTGPSGTNVMDLYIALT